MLTQGDMEQSLLQESQGHPVVLSGRAELCYSVSERRFITQDRLGVVLTVVCQLDQLIVPGLHHHLARSIGLIALLAGAVGKHLD
jgi:hypothetical protein